MPYLLRILPRLDFFVENNYTSRSDRRKLGSLILGGGFTEAHLGDSVGLVPDHNNKTNVTVK